MPQGDSDISTYKNNIKSNGEKIALELFPKRVFEIEEFLKAEEFGYGKEQILEDLNIPIPKVNVLNHKNDENSIPGQKVYSLPGGTVKCNATAKRVINMTKPLLERLVMEAQQIRLWIQFSIPRIEDGNNFGVGIQEEILSEASSIERDACTFTENINKYYIARAKIITKVAQYPHVEDYREAVNDLDVKEVTAMKYILLEIRNHYATLHDLITKNLDRIKQPRSNNAVTMY